MISAIKTFFPELVDSIKRLGVSTRLVLLLFVLVVPFITLYIEWSDVLRLFNTKILITPFQILLGIVIIILTLVVITILIKRTSNERHIYSFCEKWLEYLPFMFRFIDKIQMNEEYDKKSSWDFIGENGEEFKKFHAYKMSLRELLFKADEKALIVAENHHWKKLQKSSELFRNYSYQTPFSFILDQTQPYLLAITYKNEINPALHISEEYIEHLSYEYSSISKLWKKRIKKLENIQKQIEENA